MAVPALYLSGYSPFGRAAASAGTGSISYTVSSADFVDRRQGQRASGTGRCVLHHAQRALAGYGAIDRRLGIAEPIGAEEDEAVGVVGIEPARGPFGAGLLGEGLARVPRPRHSRRLRGRHDRRAGAARRRPASPRGSDRNPAAARGARVRGGVEQRAFLRERAGEARLAAASAVDQKVPKVASRAASSATIRRCHSLSGAGGTSTIAIGRCASSAAHPPRRRRDQRGTGKDGERRDA